MCTELLDKNNNNPFITSCRSVFMRNFQPVMSSTRFLNPRRDFHVDTYLLQPEVTFSVSSGC